MSIDRKELEKHLSSDDGLDENSRLKQYATVLPDEPMIVSNLKYKKRRWFTKWWGILIIIFILLLMIFASMFIYFYKDFVKKIEAGTIHLDVAYMNFDFSTRYDLLQISRDFNEIGGIMTLDDPWWGHPEAKVTIVEFGDYICEACKDFNNKIMPKLMEKYRNDVLFIYRDYPIMSGAEGYSVQVANVAHCIYNNLYDLNDYWNVVHNYLFLVGGYLDSIHKDLGTYYVVEKAEKCINDKMFYNEILHDFNHGEELGLKGTPSFFINGHPVSGSFELKEWYYIVDKFLAVNQ